MCAFVFSAFFYFAIIWNSKDLELNYITSIWDAFLS